MVPLPFLIATGAKIALVLFVLLTALAYTVWIERKVSARIQNRWGPTVVGPHGLLQPLADLIKFIFKEDPTPAQAQVGIYFIAPVIALVFGLMPITVIPFGDSVTVAGYTTWLQITDLNVGLLFILAMTSMGIYGIALAGWSSGSKYALIGGLRSSAQMVSYEIGLSFALVGPLLLAGSLSLRDIVLAQQGFYFGVIPKWNVWPQCIAFVMYVIAAFAETNRVPFDLPEAEGELVAGFHTEYASVKFAMFYTAEYANMFTASSLATLLFLGGWLRPLPWDWVAYTPVAVFWGLAAAMLYMATQVNERLIDKAFAFAATLVLTGVGGLFLFDWFRGPAEGVFWFGAKVGFFIFLYVWVRWTLPRFRYDTLMEFGWKFLIPVTIGNILVTALVVTLSN